MQAGPTDVAARDRRRNHRASPGSLNSKLERGSFLSFPHHPPISPHFTEDCVWVSLSWGEFSSLRKNNQTRHPALLMSEMGGGWAGWKKQAEKKKYKMRRAESAESKSWAPEKINKILGPMKSFFKKRRRKFVENCGNRSLISGTYEYFTRAYN